MSRARGKGPRHAGRDLWTYVQLGRAQCLRHRARGLAPCDDESSGTSVPGRDGTLRKEAFEALVDFLKKCPGINEDDKSLYWNDVAVIATGTSEQISVIDQMPEQGAAWADDVLDYFVENADNDTVSARAERAKDRLDEKIRRAKRSGNEDKEDSDE